MRPLLHTCLCFVVLFNTACGTQQSRQVVTQPVEPSVSQHLNKGYEYISAGSAKKAARELEAALAICDQKYAAAENAVYSARSSTEALAYLVIAAAKDESAEVDNTDCSDSLYLMGYVSLDFGQIDEAEAYLKRAVKMAPSNAMYLSELGHVYHLRRDWDTALKIFTQAEEAAKGFSPEAVKTNEQLRAKRGVGYTLIELGELDKAEAKFNECLAIDKNDAGSIRELKYIQSIRRNPKKL
ncbi:tetratricopeptide repeat protein [Saccharophagus degradans]|uniref:tetratricopeptide repeat protein n=1 Tax=Saccharophagus degradans TaxID=86304 RepID=UPI001C09DE08|nr:tetratricopeptide repeat protein [Saccharophagus degradans]